MKSIAIADTAMSGFRLMRDDFNSVLVWTGAYLAYALIGLALTIALGGAAMQELVAAASQGVTSPDALMDSYVKLAPLYAVSLPLALVFMVVMQSAVYRATLKPSDSSPGHLKLGRDEFHLAIVNIVLGLVMFGVYLALVLIFIVLGAIIGFGLSTAGSAAAGLGAIILIPIGLVLFIGSFLYVAIRLSLAGPQSIAEGKLNLFGSWALTKGNVRRLFGAYAVIGILFFIIYIVFAGAMGALVGGSIVQNPTAAVAAMTSITPVTIGLLVMTTIIGVFALVVLGTPPAYAYRQLMPVDADVFS